MSVLEEGLESLGLANEENVLDLVSRYIKELEMWNPVYSLVNASGDQLVIRHILDSLSGVAALRDLAPAKVADIGSGGGLPGIPLAICNPEVEFHLVERSGKRVDFLRNAVLSLGLKNVVIHQTPLEELKEQYDMTVFRGFSPFHPTLMKSLRKILKEGGHVLAFKGKLSSIEEELATLSTDFANESQIIPVKVPFIEKEERHMVIMNF